MRYTGTVVEVSRPTAAFLVYQHFNRDRECEKLTSRPRQRAARSGRWLAMRTTVTGKEISVLEQRQAALRAKLAETEAALQQQRQRRHSDESRKREDDLLASVLQTAESVRHTARGADSALSRLLDGELMPPPDAEAAALLGDLLAHTSASADELRYKYSGAPRGSSTRTASATEGSLLASESGAMRPRSAASGPVDPASADGPVRQAAAASQRLGASSARTAAVGGVRLSEHATLTEVPRPRKAPVLPRPRAKPAWDDRQTAITPTPWEMLPTEAEVTACKSPFLLIACAAGDAADGGRGDCLQSPCLNACALLARRWREHTATSFSASSRCASSSRI